MEYLIGAGLAAIAFIPRYRVQQQQYQQKQKQLAPQNMGPYERYTAGNMEKGDLALTGDIYHQYQGQGQGQGQNQDHAALEESVSPTTNNENDELQWNQGASQDRDRILGMYSGTDMNMRLRTDEKTAPASLSDGYNNLYGSGVEVKARGARDIENINQANRISMVREFSKLNKIKPFEPMRVEPTDISKMQMETIRSIQNGNGPGGITSAPRKQQINGVRPFQGAKPIKNSGQALRFDSENTGRSKSHRAIMAEENHGTAMVMHPTSMTKSLATHLLATDSGTLESSEKIGEKLKESSNGGPIAPSFSTVERNKLNVDLTSEAARGDLNDHAPRALDLETVRSRVGNRNDDIFFKAPKLPAYTGGDDAVRGRARYNDDQGRDRVIGSARTYGSSSDTDPRHSNSVISRRATVPVHTDDYTIPGVNRTFVLAPRPGDRDGVSDPRSGRADLTESTANRIGAARIAVHAKTVGQGQASKPPSRREEMGTRTYGERSGSNMGHAYTMSNTAPIGTGTRVANTIEQTAWTGNASRHNSPLEPSLRVGAMMVSNADGSGEQYVPMNNRQNNTFMQNGGQAVSSVTTHRGIRGVDGGGEEYTSFLDDHAAARLVYTGDSDVTKWHSRAGSMGRLPPPRLQE